ncbi:TRAP transporter large permease [Chloroflexota bacterium]
MEFGIIGLVVFLLLVAFGIPIAFAGALVGFAGMWVVAGINAATTQLSSLAYSTASNYMLATLPLFIFMGNLAYRCGFTQDIYSTARLWVGRLPGGIAVATVLGGAGFAAACGSSVAAATTLTRVALPEMQRYGYQNRLALGSIAVGGVLATIIPPSNLIIVYGILTEQSIGELLLAGYIPGILLAGLFMLTIILRAWFNPSLGVSIRGITWKERFVGLKGTIGILLLVILVMGGIYFGLFTPVEAGAVGALGTIVLGVAARRLSLRDFWLALQETARITSLVIIIIVGVIIFGGFLAYVRLPIALAQILTGLPVSPSIILMAVLFLYLILGTFMSATGMLILTLPIITPAFMALGLDPIWVGILLVLMCEIAMITPPVGVVIYAVKGAAPDVTFHDIISGIAWMLPAALLTVALVFAFPQLALFIPSLMAK